MKQFLLLLVGSYSCLANSFQQHDFLISYWWGPPPSRNNYEVWRDVKDANFNVAGIGRMYFEADHLKMLGLINEPSIGLKAIIHDRRIWPRRIHEPSYDWKKAVKETVMAFKDHPALYAYYLDDEPSQKHFEGIKAFQDEFEKYDQAHLLYTNLFPIRATTEQTGYEGKSANERYSRYLEGFLTRVGPKVLSFDNYSLLKSSVRPDFFDNLALVREKSIRYGIPAWYILQSSQFNDSYREPTKGEMRWQVFSALAYGVKGILYFYYWPPEGKPGGAGLIDRWGRKTLMYEIVKDINFTLKRMGPTLMKLKSVGIFHVYLPNDPPSQLPIQLLEYSNLLVGHCKDFSGRDFAIIVNQDTHQTQAVGLKPTGADRLISMFSVEEQNFVLGEESGTMIKVSLQPGEGILLAIGKI